MRADGVLIAAAFVLGVIVVVWLALGTAPAFGQHYPSHCARGWHWVHGHYGADQQWVHGRCVRNGNI